MVWWWLGCVQGVLWKNRKHMAWFWLGIWLCGRVGTRPCYFCVRSHLLVALLPVLYNLLPNNGQYFRGQIVFRHRSDWVTVQIGRISKIWGGSVCFVHMLKVISPVVACSIKASLKAMSPTAWGQNSCCIFAVSMADRVTYILFLLTRSSMPFSSGLFGIFVLVDVPMIRPTSIVALANNSLELLELISYGAWLWYFLWYTIALWWIGLRALSSLG